MKYPYATTAKDIETGYKRDRLIAYTSLFVAVLLLLACLLVPTVTLIAVSVIAAIALFLVSLYFMSQAKLAVVRKEMTEKEITELQLKLDSSLIIDPKTNEASFQLNSNDMVTARVDKELVKELKKPREIKQTPKDASNER